MVRCGRGDCWRRALSPRAAEPQVRRQVRVSAAAHMAALESVSLLPDPAARACDALGYRGLPEPGLQRPW